MLKIPRANTQKDVNKTVWHLLNKHDLLSSTCKVLDNPCGQGEWLEFLQTNLNNKELVGVDYSAPIEKNSVIHFFKLDSSLPFADSLNTVPFLPFDLATCISGVMAFDNFSQYVLETRKLLKPDGYLVVTNDNLWTLRDRLSYLFFGRFKRFKLNFNNAEGNWNIVNIQTLLRALEKQNFSIEEIKYTSIYFEDWLMLPFALILYFPQFLYLLFSHSDQSISSRLRTYPWLAMIARHYVILAQKKSH